MSGFGCSVICVIATISDIQDNNVVADMIIFCFFFLSFSILQSAISLPRVVIPKRVADPDVMTFKISW